jgi:murein DD-endopeptidase MepM/ murein hydrolase activator NlpD
MIAVWLVMVWSMSGLFDPPAASWVWPSESPRLVVEDFVAPESPWGPGHRGVDVDASSSDALIAPVSGRVRFVGSVVNRGVVTIETSEGWLVSMEPVTINEGVGSRVRAGQRIGTITRGHCPKRCVHVGLRIEGDYHSPLRMWGLERRAVLMPWGD